MRIATANNNARRALCRKTAQDSYDFDMRQIARMTASGTLHKRKNTRFARKMRRDQSGWRP